MGEYRTASEETKLNYIDKVAQASVSTSKSASRVMLFSCILSGLLLAMSTGMISLDEEYSLAGVKTNISLTVFLWAGGFILAILSVTNIALHKHSVAFLNEIERLYKELDYQVPEEANPFEANDAVDALWERFAASTPSGLAAIFDVVGTYTIIGALWIFPIIAEVAVVLALARNVGLGVGLGVGACHLSGSRHFECLR
jgi:hypothetical protein